MILVFGSINLDLVARVPKIARPGETVLAPGYDRFFGGKGANQAVAAARALAPDAPAIAFCGAVGDDAFGADCIANLAGEGIDVSRIEAVSAGTGCAFITVEHAGENAITVASGANRQIRADGLDDAFLAAVDVAVLQMEVPWEENAALAARARAAGAHVLLNFAPARLDIPIEKLRGFLEEIDTLVVNEHEAETLALGLGLGGGDSGRLLAEDLSLTVIVTLGAEGTRLVQAGQPDWHSPARKVEVVDTTGAGDTFVGVLATGLFEGLPVRRAIERAGLAASLSCTKAGAQAGAPTRAAVDTASLA
ncbi:ribokinase [Aureimonas populi]|uniref:Ribokinase n=1 Tax=Aureimonas populi TaxID=1701758 RepID=A0ABW5CU86_9HYPH|nr:ribokinase [Aureimonas populi]